MFPKTFILGMKGKIMSDKRRKSESRSKWIDSADRSRQKGSTDTDKKDEIEIVKDDTDTLKIDRVDTGLSRIDIQQIRPPEKIGTSGF